MDKLFEKLAQGELPNFIEMMAAISEISEMWPADVCLDCRPAKILPQNAENTPQNQILPP